MGRKEGERVEGKKRDGGRRKIEEEMASSRDCIEKL